MITNAITFDDVLLVPAYNHHASRRLVELTMTDRLGKLTLDLPIITSNMDTITEDAMANFIGEKGGMGALHRFMSIDENVAIFKRCKTKVFASIGTSEEELRCPWPCKICRLYFKKIA